MGLPKPTRPHPLTLPPPTHTYTLVSARARARARTHARARAHTHTQSHTHTHTQIELLTVKGAHFFEMGLRPADLVILGQVPPPPHIRPPRPALFPALFPAGLFGPLEQSEGAWTRRLCRAPESPSPSLGTGRRTGSKP